MAKIENVNYEAMPSQAQQMKAYGQDLNAELTNAYKSIEGMHASWYGQRYNALVKEFNEMIPQLNALLQLVVGEIPFALETIANNYSRADRGTTVTSAEKVAPNNIAELAVPSDVGMKFITEEVEAVRENVSANLKNSIDKMNSIETIHSQIQWSGEAAEAFATKFRKMKADIIAAFDNINTSFVKLMQQTQEDIQAAESANTIG